MSSNGSITSLGAQYAGLQDAVSQPRPAGLTGGTSVGHSPTYLASLIVALYCVMLSMLVM